MEVSPETPPGSDLLAEALRVAARTVATAQALADFGADVIRQAVFPGPPAPAGESAGDVAESPVTPSLPRPAGGDSACADDAALEELWAFLNERPYWSAPEARPSRWLNLGMLIGSAAARATRPLAGYELVGLAYHAEHTDQSSPSTGAGRPALASYVDRSPPDGE